MRATKVCEYCGEPSRSGEMLRWRAQRTVLAHLACWENALLPDVPCRAPGCRLRIGHRFLHDIRAAS